MWMARLLVFGPAVAVIAAAWLLWQGWTRQPEWRAPDSARDVVWLQQIDSLEQALRDPAWSWLWRAQVGRQLLRVDAEGRVRPDLVRAWRSYQTTRLFFSRADDVEEAERRLRDLGVEQWVAWGLSKVEPKEGELLVRFDRANEPAAVAVVDLMSDLSLIPLTRMRVSARDHAEQLAREFIQDGTETAGVKALWLDGFEAFEMILAGGSDRVGQEMELRLAARPGLVPQMEMRAHGRRLDEMVLEMDLDPQASWHDGTPFTSADVMELTDRWRAGFGVLPGVLARVAVAGEGLAGPGVGEWPGSDLFRRIMAWEKEGDHRVSVRLWEPSGSLISPWTEVPVLRLQRGEDGSERILGCGPVEVRQWREGDRIVLRSRAKDQAADNGRNRLGRMMLATVPEVEWRQAAGSEVTARRAELGLVGAVAAGPERRRHQAAFFEKAQWQAVDSRIQADWWLLWLPPAGGRAAAANGNGAAGLDQVELRRWLTSLIDPGRLADTMGASFQPLRPWWLGNLQDEGGEGDNNESDPADSGLHPSIKVVLEIEAGAASGRELREALARMWQGQDVEVEWSSVGDSGETNQADPDQVVLRARLVRVRPDDAMAWAALWFGRARPDGGDMRMDELVKQLGEALENGAAKRPAESIGLRVERLGWGMGLLREGRRFLLAPDWLPVENGAETEAGWLRGLLFEEQAAMAREGGGGAAFGQAQAGEVRP